MKNWFRKFVVKTDGVHRGEAGGVAVYFAFFIVLALGVGALALDVGRMTVLRSQMQDRADAGAMAAATQLDGRVGAQTRATAVATNGMSQTSGISGDSQTLNVQTVNFYSEYGATPVAATGDEDSKFIEVILEPRRVDFLLEPVLNPSGTDHYKNLAARAVAGSNPFICQAPPLMICDLGEIDPAMNLSLQSNIGRQIVLKPPPGGNSAWAPGNYGLLGLPDGSTGASDIENALAAVQPEDCYSLDVSTAPGGKTNKVKDGINARFDLPGGLPYPAPDVINYPKDVEIEASPQVMMGSGNWPLGGLGGYWAAKHGGPVPNDMLGASRYQVYLYEQGLEFGRSDTDGQTIYPVVGALPAGYTLVSPAAPSIPEDAANPDDPDYDGVPSQTVASNGQARRLMKVAVLQCIAEGVKGSHAYPTNGNFVEIFITQSVKNKAVYGEIVRPLTPSNDPGFHANVKLVQ